MFFDACIFPVLTRESDDRYPLASVNISTVSIVMGHDVAVMGVTPWAIALTLFEA